MQDVFQFLFFPPDLWTSMDFKVYGVKFSFLFSSRILDFNDFYVLIHALIRTNSH